MPPPPSAWSPATRSTPPPDWSRRAGPNEVLIGELTYRLVRDAVDVEPVEPLELKGKAERVPAYRLLAVHAGVEGLARRQDAPDRRPRARS